MSALAESATPGPLLAVEKLRVVVARSRVDVVDGVSFDVRSGEVLGLVGESGSGKTTVALALMGHARRGLLIDGGEVRLGDRNILRLGSQLRQLRGGSVAYVAQDPVSALNPALKIGTQLREVLVAHREDHPLSVSIAERIRELLAEVRLASSPVVLDSYPHQLSGGQQQRVMLAMAFACRPQLIVLDEPTTGLDVTTQRHVLDTIRGLCRVYHVGAVYVSHDLAVVAEIADAIGVMYAGRLVELGPTGTVFRAPGHPYTRGLLRAIPSPTRAHVLEGMEGRPPRPGARPPGCSFAPRCEFAQSRCKLGFPPPSSIDDQAHWARCLRADEVTRLPPLGELTERSLESAEAPPDGLLLEINGLSASYDSRQVLYDIHVAARAGSCLAIVGESGAGKTTLARCIVGLHRRWSGTITFKGSSLAADRRRRHRGVLRATQYIFQNPYTSLNPRKTVGQLVEQPLRQLSDVPARERSARVVATLEQAALDADYLARYPDQLSGGERQRVAIARALVVAPELLVCDEVTSSLDVSVQAAIVELLHRLQMTLGLTLVLITHNLALVRSLADDVVILQDGRVVEQGQSAEVLDRPRSDYAAQLLADVPRLTLEVEALDE